MLSGCDGSGKTTLVRVLAAYFSGRGSVGWFWLRGSHLFASLLLRFFSRVGVFRGACNPYYGVCLPEALRGVWALVEFWSVLPYLLLRRLLSAFFKFFVCDRGVLDFVVWVVATLDYPRFISSLCGRFLLRLASREGAVYLYADRDVLVKRADVPASFVARECAVYGVLAKYFARCRVNTGAVGPAGAAARVLKCVG